MAPVAAHGCAGRKRAKQVTDSFVVRIGDVLSSATVFVGTALLALGTSQFAWINVVLVAVWIAVAVLVGREFRRRTKTSRVGSA